MIKNNKLSICLAILTLFVLSLSFIGCNKSPVPIENEKAVSYKLTEGWFNVNEFDQWKLTKQYSIKNRIYQRFERKIGNNEVEVRFFYIENLQTRIVPVDQFSGF